MFVLHIPSAFLIYFTHFFETYRVLSQTGLKLPTKVEDNLKLLIL